MKNNIKNQSRFVQNPSKIDPKNDSRSMKVRPWSVFGAAPNCAQVGPRTLTLNLPTGCLTDFWNIIWVSGPIFAPPREIADRSKIVLLSIDGHFDPRKMPSGRGFGKNMKIEWKIDAKIERFLMAQNHVWRYTLRLFHTFAIFEKIQKIDAQRDPKSCVFLSKNRSWAPQGRLILQFLMIFGDSKNHWFFYVYMDRLIWWEIVPWRM